MATFRAVVKKYPRIEPSRILLDLAKASGECGRFFAAAKDSGPYDIALQFAPEGQTDPRTLSRASRDFAGKNPQFALVVGKLALERFLAGYGYEGIGADIVDAYRHFMAAAEILGVRDAARLDAERMAKGSPFEGTIAYAMRSGPGAGRD